MEIREAIEEDIPQITQMKKREDLEQYLKRVRETKEEKAIYLVMENDGVVIGHVFLKFYGTKKHPDYPEIEDLFIREDLRSRGIGTRLIEMCEKLAKEKGFNKIGLGVNPTLNPRAKALYERLGYKDLGEGLYCDAVYDGTEDWVFDMVKKLQ